MPFTISPASESPTSELDQEDKPSTASLQANETTVGDPTQSSPSQVDSLSRGGQGRMEFEADAGDDLLPRVNTQEAQPPKVTYHHG